MKSIIDKIKSRFTMKSYGTLFYDVVDCKPVKLYIDCFGTQWMAHSRFGFRTTTGKLSMIDF